MPSCPNKENWVLSNLLKNIKPSSQHNQDLNYFELLNMLFFCYSMQKKKFFFYYLTTGPFCYQLLAISNSHSPQPLSTSHKEDGEGYGRLIYGPRASVFLLMTGAWGPETGSWHQGLQDAQSKLNMEMIGAKFCPRTSANEESASGNLQIRWASQDRCRWGSCDWWRMWLERTRRVTSF